MPDGDFATLGKLYSFVAENKLEARVQAADGVVTSSPQPTEPPPAPTPSRKRKPARRLRAKAAAAAPQAADVVAPTAPPTPAAEGTTADLTQSFTRYKAGQKDSRGRGKLFTSAQVKEWLPRWDAAKAAYLAAVPEERRLKGTQIMHHTIAELYALAGREPESEGSPLPLPPAPKRRAGRPQGGQNKSKGQRKSSPSAAPRRGPGRPSLTPKSPNAKRIKLRKKTA